MDKEQSELNMMQKNAETEKKNFFNEQNKILLELKEQNNKFFYITKIKVREFEKNL